MQRTSFGEPAAADDRCRQGKACESGEQPHDAVKLCRGCEIFRGSCCNRLQPSMSGEGGEGWGRSHCESEECGWFCLFAKRSGRDRRGLGGKSLELGLELEPANASRHSCPLFTRDKQQPAKPGPGGRIQFLQFDHPLVPALLPHAFLHSCALCIYLHCQAQNSDHRPASCV